MSASLLAGLSPQEPDKILRLMAQFAADPRADKVDLGVGVYRDAAGHTPVMGAVAAAEAQLLQQQTTKTYVALEGDPAFHAAVRDLVLGDAVAADRVAALATPGGTGAVRHAFELAARANPDLTVWLPSPTWPNHTAIAAAMGLPMRTYRYYDADASGLDRTAMFSDLTQARPGDLVLLHGCCHNPTGADLAIADWHGLAESLTKTGAVPLVDLAYLGFGAGVEDDAEGLRILASLCPEMLIAFSGSKSFGLYRDRVGLFLAVCSDTQTQAVTAANMAWLNRLSYAFPPDHGARVVTSVLTDTALQAQWRDELDNMRLRIARLRAALAHALRERTGSDRFGFLAGQRGMFSLIGATPAQVDTLRAAHGVYMVGDGRINIAGLRTETIPAVADALTKVLHQS